MAKFGREVMQKEKQIGWLGECHHPEAVRPGDGERGRPRGELGVRGQIGLEIYESGRDFSNVKAGSRHKMLLLAMSDSSPIWLMLHECGKL